MPVNKTELFIILKLEYHLHNIQPFSTYPVASITEPNSSTLFMKAIAI